MMKFVKPSVIKGTVKAPASKSMLQRALAAALLSDGPTTITNVTYSSDCLAALGVIEGLGARVKRGNDRIEVSGGSRSRSRELDCGEAGLSIRMFSPIAALSEVPLTLTGRGSLLKRPVTMIGSPLRDLGVRVSTSNGYPPLTVTGPLLGGSAIVDGSISSQFLTGLLMALPVAPADSRLTVNHLKSIPYIDMTLSLLADFGIRLYHDRYRTFNIPGRQSYRRETYHTEGDWSGASFLLVAGALGGGVTVTGLNPRSPQADRAVLQALTAAGAGIKIGSDSIEVVAAPLRGFRFDALHCPDLFPPLVALACHCTGTTEIHGVERLVHKESNRARALQEEFGALGARLQIRGNTMEIGGGPLGGGEIDSHNDHRIAMAGAVAAVKSGNGVTIKDAACVAKSYPEFFRDLVSIGGKIDE